MSTCRQAITYCNNPHRNEHRMFTTAIENYQAKISYILASINHRVSPAKGSTRCYPSAHNFSILWSHLDTAHETDPPDRIKLATASVLPATQPRCSSAFRHFCSAVFSGNNGSPTSALGSDGQMAHAPFRLAVSLLSGSGEWNDAIMALGVSKNR